MRCVQKVLVFFITINIAGIAFLRHYDVFYKTVPLKNFDVLECNFPKTLNNTQNHKNSSPKAIMQKVMNSVSKGHNCNDMSELFLHALRLQGYKARKLFVVKSIGDQHATHTLVEVFENNKWVIYDPTFNVSFKKNDQLLGATDIATSLLDGSFKDIQPLFYGEVVYSARLETYPIYWLAHFNNILFFKYGYFFPSFIMRVAFLPFRYWYGPVLYYFSETGNPNDYLELINWFYFIFTFILPLFVLSLSGLILILFFKEKLQNKLR